MLYVEERKIKQNGSFAFFVLLINIETANTTFDGVPIMTESMPEFGLKRPCAKESFSR